MYSVIIHSGHQPSLNQYRQFHVEYLETRYNESSPLAWITNKEITFFTDSYISQYSPELLFVTQSHLSSIREAYIWQHNRVDNAVLQNVAVEIFKSSTGLQGEIRGHRFSEVWKYTSLFRPSSLIIRPFFVRCRERSEAEIHTWAYHYSIWNFFLNLRSSEFAKSSLNVVCEYVLQWINVLYERTCTLVFSNIQYVVWNSF